MEGHDLYNIDPITYFQQCYDKKSPLYRFKTYFFNLKQENFQRVSIFDQNEDSRLLKQALEENSNHEKYYPAFAKGFEDLETRKSWQRSYHEYQRVKMLELRSRMDSIQRKMYLDIFHKTRKIRTNYISILSKIISIISCSHSLNRDFSNRFSSQEKNLFNNFIIMQNCLEKFKIRLLEISLGSNASQCFDDVIDHQELSEISKVSYF